MLFYWSQICSLVNYSSLLLESNICLLQLCTYLRYLWTMVELYFCGSKWKGISRSWSRTWQKISQTVSSLLFFKEKEADNSKVKIGGGGKILELVSALEISATKIHIVVAWCLKLHFLNIIALTIDYITLQIKEIQASTPSPNNYCLFFYMCSHIYLLHVICIIVTNTKKSMSYPNIKII